ncbi:hypothetical protein M5C99_15055 [Acidovorax sp. NCPPB 2350]|nr:hypothetical protein M5C99_15055 [Acidovorax sp. NCPPB 2350]
MPLPALARQPVPDAAQADAPGPAPRHAALPAWPAEGPPVDWRAAHAALDAAPHGHAGAAPDTPAGQPSTPPPSGHGSHGAHQGHAGHASHGTAMDNAPDPHGGHQP